MKTIKTIILAALIAICGMTSVLVVPARDAMAAITCPAGSKNKGQEAALGLTSIAECNLDKSGDHAGSAVMNRINAGINVVLGVLGVVAVAMIIVGGIQYATSQGDAAKATRARNTILYSIVGLVIALLAFAIVNFVLTNVFK